MVECTSDDPDAQLALRSEDATMYENGTARIMVTLNNLDAANQTFMCAITSAPASCRGFLFQSRVRVYSKFHHAISSSTECPGFNSAHGYLNISHDFVQHGCLPI